MKHIASLVKDGRVAYALVDDETGQLVPFAEIVLPHPEHFGLVESALLGTNLVEVIGLNGRSAGRPKRVTTALPPKDQPQLELDAPTPEPEPERRRPPQGRKASAPRPYIPVEDVLAVINRHPEGIMVAQIADELLDAQGYPDHGRQWATVAVSNRLLNVETRWKEGKAELPYRREMVPFVRADGTVSPSQQSKVLYPLAAS
jgi:hypothetical protein